MNARRRESPDRRRLIPAAALAALLVCSATACSPDGISGSGSEGSFVFTLATGATPGVASAEIQDWFLDQVEEATDGRITFERTAVESMCKAAEVADCVRDGRAEIGAAVPDYTPQYFPTTSVVSIPFLGQNGQAIMQSLYEMHRDFEPAKTIMDKNNLHHIGTWPVGSMLIGSKQEIADVDDLAGLQARASGPILQEVLGQAGMNVVAITATETYEAAERGVINTVAAGLDFPVKFKLTEVLPYWTDPGIGQYSAYSMWLNRDAYESLPDDLREIFDGVVEELNSGAAMDTLEANHVQQCEEIRSSGATLSTWKPDAIEAWESTVGDSAEEQWVELTTEQGLTDAASVLEEYKSGLERHADSSFRDATRECVSESSQ